MLKLLGLECFQLGERFGGLHWTSTVFYHSVSNTLH